MGRVKGFYCKLGKHWLEQVGLSQIVDGKQVCGFDTEGLGEIQTSAPAVSVEI